MDIPRPDSSAPINFILFPGHDEASVVMENPGADRAVALSVQPLSTGKPIEMASLLAAASLVACQASCLQFQLPLSYLSLLCTFVACLSMVAFNRFVHCVVSGLLPSLLVITPKNLA
jgi:hypothetical protein